MFTHAAVDSVWHEPTLVLLIVLFVGMILVLKRLRAGEPPTIMIPFPYHPARVVLVGVLAILSALLVIRPAAAWYAFAEGQRELAAGRPDQARDRYAWAARIDPGTSAYHDATALAEVSLYRQSGERRRLQGAISEEQIGLELNPLDGRLANRLGELCVLLAEHTDTDVRQKQALLEQAAAYYEQAIQLDPYSPFNYVELGRLRLAQGRLGEAQAWFRQAIG
jgi:tetratricopeptide (TPR) repeat protein